MSRRQPLEALLLVDDHVRRSHVVHFYAADDELIDVAGDFLAEGLSAGESCLVLATPTHCVDLRAACDPDGSASREGRFVVVDAEATLGRFMAGGAPVAADFNTVVGDILNPLPASVFRVYGDMVGGLGREGDVVAATSVEALWNELAARTALSLFCAYPTSVGFPIDEVSAICDLHTSMVRGPPRQGSAELSHTFVSSRWSLGAVRRLVSTTMRRWGYEEVAADAELVASELATNAVLHARSHFSIGLSRRGGQVRIVVGDSDNTPPIARAPSRAGRGGLGLHVIESIATCWGHEVHSNGKVVWADLACEPATRGSLHGAVPRC